MAKRSNRRDFLKFTGAAAGAAAFGYWVAPRDAFGQDQPKLPPAPESTSPNEKVDLAVVGVSGRGAADIEDIKDLANIVALCDVDDRNLDKQAATFPKADRFNDFRKMLESPKQKFDAV